MSEVLKKLREQEIEMHYEQGYAFVGEEQKGQTLLLEFKRSDDPKITVIIED